MKNIAFIGTREVAAVPEQIRDLYDKAAACAVWSGYRVVTGAAKGFDQIAAVSALIAGGRVLLKLPWREYEQSWWSWKMKTYPGNVEIEIYNRSVHDDWSRSVFEYHPNADALTRGAFALHARNFGIIKDARCVVAVSNPEKLGGGGTGQAIRIAAALGIRCYDLSQSDHFQELEKRLTRFPD